MAKVHSAQQHYDNMTKTPVHILVLKLSAPTIISMLVTSIYNMADTFFVSRLGTSATGAVSVVFTVMAVFQAVGFMLSMGTGNLISRVMGEGDYKKGTQIASSGFVAALLFGATLCVLGIIFIDPLVYILGATDTIAPYAKQYLSYILFAAPFMATSYVMNNILRSQGKAALSMIGLSTGGVLNIILDPIFIFVFELGIAGAAIATALSQFTSFCILLYMMLSGKSAVKLKLNAISKDINTYIKIVQTGFPSFCRQGLSSTASLMLNWQARGFGDAAVAGMGVKTRFLMLLFSFVLGLGQALQPVSGFNYGAKKFGRVRNALVFTSVFGSAVTMLMGVLGYIFAPQLIAIFAGTDAAVLEIGTFAMRSQCLVLPCFGAQISFIMALQSTGNTRLASFLSTLRQGIFFIPIVVILPYFFGILGVQLAQPLSDFLAFALSVPFYIIFIKKLNNLEEIEIAKIKNGVS